MSTCMIDFINKSTKIRWMGADLSIDLNIAKIQRKNAYIATDTVQIRLKWKTVK